MFYFFNRLDKIVKFVLIKSSIQKQYQNFDLKQSAWALTEHFPDCGSSNRCNSKLERSNWFRGAE